ncbi:MULTISPECIES: TetR/AcrR family transcriptional regulator [Chitinophagaceae]
MSSDLTKNCKKIQILDAATEVFATKGFEGASIRELASAAKVNIAMINYYFGSKEKLFNDVVNYHSEYMYASLKEIVTRTNITYLEKVFLLIDLQVDKLIQNREFHKLIHHEIMLNQRNEVSESIRKIITKISSLSRSIIEDGIAAGEFREVDVELTLSALYGTINQLFLSKSICKIILNVEQTDKDPFNPELKQRLIAYLRDLMEHYLVK